MSHVLVVGALHLDVVVDVARMPVRDETLFGKGVAYRIGGKGANQALAAARMGARVAMAGQVGEDEFATNVLAELDRGNVDCAQVRQVPGATGMSVAMVEPDGEYRAVVVSGVNGNFDANTLGTSDASVILLQNEIPQSANLNAAKQNSGATIILNAAPAKDVSAELWSMVDLLIVNRIEAAQVMGQGPRDLDAVATSKALATMGPKAVVVTLGADGAVFCSGQTCEFISPPKRATGSAHGAGDAFVGTLAAELQRGAQMVSALEFASASAAFFVQTAADKRHRLTRSDVLDWS